MVILISDPFDPSLEKKLSDFGEVTADKKRLTDANVVIVRSKTECTKEYINNAPELKIIVRGGIGLDNIDKNYAESKGIIVKNTPKSSAIAVAELTFALMLSVPNRLIEAHNSMLKGEWIKKQLTRTELYGKTLCLIGMGSIAAEVAKRAAVFGMNITSFRKSGKKSKHADVKENIREAVKNADYISLHIPLTDETKGIINRKTLDSMKESAVLINTSRAKCVVAEDIAEALKSGKLKHYACDVWPSDPPPEDYSLLLWLVSISDIPIPL